MCPHFDSPSEVIMCLTKYSVPVLLVLLLDCYALNCRTDTGLKEDELKTIYKTCLKKQDGKNSSRINDSNMSLDHGGQSKRNEWDNKDDTHSTTDDDRDMNSRNGMGKRYGSREGNGYRSTTGRENIGSRDYNSKNDYNNGNGDYRENTDYSGNGDYGSESKDYSLNRGDGMRSTTGTTRRSNNGYGKDNFPQSNEFGGEYSNSERNQFGGYPSTSYNRGRYKREKRTGMNSGQRSQYNPNTSTMRPTSLENSKNNKNNTDKDDEKKACALHCFLENLEMIGDDGMPDKYLVTHSFLKDIKNEDMKDFLQESIEECFQILDNENTENKCQFSLILLMCLSEKGKANCDDWKDEMF